MYSKHARAMSRAKEGKQQVPILKKTTGLCHSRSYYPMILLTCTEVVSHESYEGVGRGQVEGQGGKGRGQDVERPQQP